MMRMKVGRPKQQPRGDYPVGYAKTPKHTRFKPGNAVGRTGGRPKGRNSNATLLREILEMKLEIPLPGGASRRGTALEAAVLKILSKALGGDVRAFEQVKELAKEVGIAISEPPPPDENLAADEAATLQQFLDTVGAEAVANYQASTAIPAGADFPIVIRLPDRPTVRRVVFGPRATVVGSEGSQ